MNKQRRFFSATTIIGSRPSSVGVGVSDFPGAAWLFNRRYPRAAWTLALATPRSWNGKWPKSLIVAVRYLAPDCTLSVRRYQGREFFRIRGPISSLREFAEWYSTLFFADDWEEMLGRGS